MAFAHQLRRADLRGHDRRDLGYWRAVGADRFWRAHPGCRRKFPTMPRSHSSNMAAGAHIRASARSGSRPQCRRTGGLTSTDTGSTQTSGAGTGYLTMSRPTGAGSSTIMAVGRSNRDSAGTGCPATNGRPAWVNWRYGDQYAGWAPLPPDELIETSTSSNPLTGCLCRAATSPRRAGALTSCRCIVARSFYERPASSIGLFRCMAGWRLTPASRPHSSRA